LPTSPARLSPAPTGVAQPAWRAEGLMRSLGAPHAVPVAAQALPQPHWVLRNDDLANQLGWADWLQGDASLGLLAGNTPPPHDTLATVYSGHQFGVWAGQLGDGRALLLGEADSTEGALEIQLKGAGLTPYSRMGDGRAVLRSSIREYLCSEAMHALGVPTTRALALVGSPLPVRRETLETAAVVTRVAPSFLRFGHFEHFAHTADDTAALQALADAVISRFYPETQDAAQPVAALLEAIALRTARLMAQWQAVGFCHGVMNTDNMSALGLTIDYGPFGFLDAFDPGHICNHSDHQGRYAWAKQPNVAFWNLHALAQGLLPLLGERLGSAEAASEAALAALEPYKTAFPEAMLGAWCAKLGLLTAQSGDRDLADDWLKLMAADRCDFSIAFRRLCSFSSVDGVQNDAVRDLFLQREAFDAWARRYRTRLQAEGSVDAERAQRMRATNPSVVLRNHLAESAIRQAQAGDFTEVQRLARVLQHPFDERPESDSDAGFPPDWAQDLSVSCSS
jgi:serine/tyrosine/threonine adenylyltransferase